MGLVLLLAAGIWVNNFRWTSVLAFSLLTPLLLWIANYSYEKYEFIIDRTEGTVQLHRQHKFVDSMEYSDVTPLSDLKSIEVERGLRATRRLIIVFKGKKIPFTESYDSTGRHERAAKLIQSWLEERESK